jgi:hypothetical protein
MQIFLQVIILVRISESVGLKVDCESKVSYLRLHSQMPSNRALPPRSRSPTVGSIDDESSNLDDDQNTHASDPVNVTSDVNQEPEDDPEKELGKFSISLLYSYSQFTCAKAIKKTWRSAIYSFFKSDVQIQYHDGRLCHFFPCAARKCKSPAGGVRRYQDSRDKASTANLRYHANQCFGEEAVKTATSAADADAYGRNGSIFAAFARQGQKPVHHSHRSHTNIEVQ